MIPILDAASGSDPSRARCQHKFHAHSSDDFAVVTLGVAASEIRDSESGQIRLQADLVALAA